MTKKNRENFQSDLEDLITFYRPSASFSDFAWNVGELCTKLFGVKDAELGDGPFSEYGPYHGWISGKNDKKKSSDEEEEDKASEEEASEEEDESDKQG